MWEKKEIDTAKLHEWEVRHAANSFSVGTLNTGILWFQSLFIRFLQPSKLVTCPSELGAKWNNLGEPGKFFWKRKSSHILLKVNCPYEAVIVKMMFIFSHCDCVLFKLRWPYLQNYVCLVPSKKKRKIYVKYLLSRGSLSVYFFNNFAILIMHWVEEKMEEKLWTR